LDPQSRDLVMHTPIHHKRVPEPCIEGQNTSSKTNQPIFLLLAFVLLIGTLITYSNHFKNGFHFDDSHVIVDNVYIRNIRNIPLFFRDGTTFSSLPTNQSYRPVVSATLAIDYWLGKRLEPFYFHLTTFILFLFQGLLIFLLYFKIVNLSLKHPWNKFFSLFATAWYMLHPANAETINYVSARSDTLSTQFLLFALVLFIYLSRCRKWHLYLIPAGIGILAKPIAGVFPILLLAYLILFEKRISLAEIFHGKNFPALASSFKIVLPSLLFCGIVVVFMGRMGPATWVAGGSSFYHYVITQPYVILRYFTTFFLPIDLSADTDWTPFKTLLDGQFFIGILFLLGLLWAAVASSRIEKRRPISFGILWFFIALLPTSLTPLAEVMNDHRIFFPYVGLTMSVSWAIALALSHLKKPAQPALTMSRSLVVAILVVFAAYGYGTYQRNNVWHTEETLWRDVTEKSPNNGRGLMNYGLTLMAKADYTGAERYFNKALALTPDYAFLLVNLGILKEATGRPIEAESFFGRAIISNAGYPGSYFYYARFLKKQGRVDEAIQNLNKTLALLPAHLNARHLLMDIYFERGQSDELVDQAKATLLLVPEDQKAIAYLQTAKESKFPVQVALDRANTQRTPESFLQLSLKYYEAGQFTKCIDAAEEALKLRPGYGLAYNNICAAYNALKQWDKAIEAGEKAVKLNPSHQLARNNLAWAKNQKMKSEKVKAPMAE
jgi:protein O-mannosyl-transferase